MSRPRERPESVGDAEVGLDPRIERAVSRALWTCLATLALARAALVFVPSMWGWGLNLMRFLPALAGWGLWTLSALALIPWVARRSMVALAGAAGFVELRPRVAAALAAAGAMILVWSIPDRAAFVGDFILRQGMLALNADPRHLFPQAMPLDLFVHFTIPAALVRHGWIDAAVVPRVFGALVAGSIGALAVGTPRVFGFTGVSGVACAATALFGGALGLCAGYNKAFAELSALTLATGLLASRLAREGRGALVLGVTLAVAVGLHRSAFMLFAPALAGWTLWLGAARGEGVWRRPSTIFAALIPLAALVATLPRVVDLFLHFDLAAHVLPEGGAGPGWLSAFGGMRCVDLMNLVVWLAPIAPVAVVIAWLLRKQLSQRREFPVLVALVAPLALMTLVVQPIQGTFRDWDVGSGFGIALSLLAAWVIGEALRRAPRAAWLGVAVVFATAVSTLQLLVHQNRAESGIARAAAFVAEPPPRSMRDRSATWDYLGLRNYGLGRFTAAAAAFARSAEVAPTPHVLEEWAEAEMRAGHWEAAQRIYQRLLLGRPDKLPAWRALALASLRRGDRIEARRAVEAWLARDPGNPDALEALKAVEAFERGAASP